MEGSDDDFELVPLTDGQAEQFARIEQLWPEFGNSLQVLAASEGGGMGWRTVDGVEYLTRYTQENGKKKGRSLGRRSPETEAIMEQFDSTVLKARRIRRELREDVLLSCKLAKAYGIARLHGRFAEALDWLWYTGANARVALFGGSALLAYESGSKTLTSAGLIKESHLQFIAHAEDPAKMGLVEIAEACGADPNEGEIAMERGRIVIRSDDQLIAEIFPPSYFLERLERSPRKTLREGFEMPWLRALTFSRDTRPIELCVPDPTTVASRPRHSQSVWASPTASRIKPPHDGRGRVLRGGDDPAAALCGDPAAAIGVAFTLMPIEEFTLEVDIAMTALLRCALERNAAAALVLAQIVGLTEFEHEFATELAASWYVHGRRHSANPRQFSEAEAVLLSAFRQRHRDGENA